MSAVGTILLHSPGWNEGKARNGTLGKHGQKRIELRRSGTYPSTQMPQRINTWRRKTTNRNDTNQMRAVSAAPTGLNKCVSMINPGLAPWAMQEYRPYRALRRFHHQINHFLILMRLPLKKHRLRDTVGRSQYACALTCKHFSKYDVNTFISTRTHECKYVYLFS